MLESIHLKNFQSHRDTLVKFGNGVVLIVGSTDSGKSAIIRALKWVVYNRPLGSNFKSGFADEDDEVRVTVRTVDGHVVERIKSNEEDYYVVDGEKLTALRGRVPEEVSKALRLTDVNFQYQHSDYFLIGETPGNVAKAFNELVGLEAGDKCIQIAKKLYESKRKELKYLEDKEYELQTQIEEFDATLTQIEPLFKKTKDLKGDIDTITSEITKLHQLLVNVKTVQARLTKLDCLETLHRQWCRCEDLLEEIEDTSLELGELEITLNRYEEIHERLLKYTDLSTLEGKINTTENLLDRFIRYDEKVTNLSSLIKRILRIRRKIEIVSSQTEELQQQLSDEMGEVCPLCERPFD